MAGAQGKMKRSLQLRLSFWVSIIVLAIGIGAGAFSFFSTFREAIELQDDQIRQLITLMERQHLILPAGTNAHYVQAAADDAFMIARFSDGEEPANSTPEHALFEVVRAMPNGMQTITFQGYSWRVFLSGDAGGSRLIAGQRTEARDETALNAAVQTLVPLLVSIPLLLVAVRVLIRGMFDPLTRLASKLDKPAALELLKIEDPDVPSEIEPFVLAMNKLFERLANAAAFQRRFVADAAHELRSPLTALSLQAESLETENLRPRELKQRLAVLRSGIARTRALLDQLLNFARAQEERTGEDQTAVSLQSVLRFVLEDLYPSAEAKQIDIGFTGTTDAHVKASEAEMVSIMKNLIDNALRYTPAGGRVDMTIEAPPEGPVFQIEDTGPGISPEERERVFDPFYRIPGGEVPGSGLGLSIVLATADKTGAKIQLGYVDEKQKKGLRVRVRFPSI